jgi:hypothetical protein
MLSWCRRRRFRLRILLTGRVKKYGEFRYGERSLWGSTEGLDVRLECGPREELRACRLFLGCDRSNIPAGDLLKSPRE